MIWPAKTPCPRGGGEKKRKKNRMKCTWQGSTSKNRLFILVMFEKKPALTSTAEYIGFVRRRWYVSWINATTILIQPHRKYLEGYIYCYFYLCMSWTKSIIYFSGKQPLFHIFPVRHFFFSGYSWNMALWWAFNLMVYCTTSLPVKGIDDIKET